MFGKFFEQLQDTKNKKFAQSGNLSAFLEGLSSQTTHIYHEPPHPAQLVDTASLGWHQAVQQGFGFPHVYSHQAESYRLLQGGKNVIITTPTASGKTGAFFPAIFQRLLERPSGTALLIYPLVALGQDQREKLEEFAQRGGFHWKIGAFQGNARAEEVFDGARIVTATPDKLHWALTQRSVREFLSHLEYIVLDEAHTYRGGFGCEVSGLLRRVLTLARQLGATPRVVLSTATIGNPTEFALELLGIEASEVSQSGAARHGKDYYLADHRGFPRKFWDSVVGGAVEHNVKVLVFFKGRQRAKQMHSAYLNNARYARYVHLYLAGVSRREERLREFRQSKGGVMFATTALEAGVDIGDLEVVIVDGFPGTRMSFRQMVGRAGRVAAGAGIFLPSVDGIGQMQPIDYFYHSPENFKQLMTGDIESAVIKADNPYIAPRHQQRKDVELGYSHFSPNYWSLRGDLGAQFYVVEEDDYIEHDINCFNDAIETTDIHYAHLEKHEGALFSLDGESYKVIRWDTTPKGTAILVKKRENDGFVTQGQAQLSFSPIKISPWKTIGSLSYRYGSATIQTSYTGYDVMEGHFERVCHNCNHQIEHYEKRCPKCRSSNIRDVMRFSKINSVIYEPYKQAKPFQSDVLEITIELTEEERKLIDEQFESIIKKGEEERVITHTLKHLLLKLLPTAVSCDAADVAGSLDSEHPERFFLYDNWQGGLGVVAKLEEQLESVLREAYQLCKRPCCNKEEGCYQCIAIGRCQSRTIPTSKALTADFLESILAAPPEQAMRPHPQPPIVGQSVVGRPTVKQNIAQHPPIASKAPAQPPAHASGISQALQVRVLREMNGLGIPEIAQQLGISHREVQSILERGGELRVRHPKFGDGIFVQAQGKGEKREVMIHFGSLGMKRLLLKYSQLTPLE